MSSWKIPLSGPEITDLERAAVLEVLNGRYLSLGPKLSEFEKRFAHIFEVKEAVAVNSGTSALHLSVKALGIQEGDEVITTPFSFISSANCILYERAFPVFVDVDPQTFNLDPSRLEEKISERTKALLPVHVFGHPCDMDAVMNVSGQFGLPVIEDACEAIGSTFKGRKVGVIGNCGVFSFYPNKPITTGEGGVIVTDNSELADLCRSLRNQGRGSGDQWLNHERLGYNYRLSDIHCALGIAQLNRIEDLLGKRKKVAEIYNALLKSIPEIRIPFHSPDVEISWFVYVILLGENYSKEQRNSILKGMREEGIGCSNYFPVIHLSPFYKRKFGFKKGDYPVAESISERTIALPFFGGMNEKDVEFVVKKLTEWVQRV